MYGDHVFLKSAYSPGTWLRSWGGGQQAGGLGAVSVVSVPADQLAMGVATFKVYSLEHKADGDLVMLGDRIQLENLYGGDGHTSRWLETCGVSIEAGGLNVEMSPLNARYPGTANWVVTDAEAAPAA